MIVIETVLVAFAMFSALPIPQPVWNERNMRYAMCAFPLVGAVCGGAWLGWWAVCAYFSVPGLLRGAGLCMIPVLVTGGIHLDGYADTCDALASCAPPEKKQEILSDPRCGAFAVIRVCGYFVCYFAFAAVLVPTGRAVGCMGLAFILERALSGLAISRFPLAKNTGLAHAFATASDRKNGGRILAVTAACCIGGMVLLGGWTGGVMAAAGLTAFWRYARTAKRQFGGISGDLAGWFLQRAELWMLGALTACQIIGGGLT